MNASNAESLVHANEIICCDWSLGAELLESKWQFPLGDSSSLFIHDEKFPITIHKWSINAVHMRLSQVFSISELIATGWWLPRVLKSSVLLHLIQLTSFADASLNNITVMLLWPLSELLGNLGITRMWPSLQGEQLQRACEFTPSLYHL